MPSVAQVAGSVQRRESDQNAQALNELQAISLEGLEMVIRSRCIAMCAAEMTNRESNLHAAARAPPLDCQPSAAAHRLPEANIATALGH